MKVKITYKMELFIPQSMEYGGKAQCRRRAHDCDIAPSSCSCECHQIRQRPARCDVAQDDEVQCIVSSELRELHLLDSPALSIWRMGSAFGRGGESFPRYELSDDGGRSLLRAILWTVLTC